MVYEISSRRKRREGYHTIVVTRLWDQQQVSMLICTECRHISENEERYKAHLKEPRHINNYRDLAYKGKIRKSFYILKKQLKSITIKRKLISVIFDFRT